MAAVLAQPMRRVARGDAEYPALLAELDGAPSALYAIGAPPAGPCFSIVGTRRATPEGKNIARRFARELARAGFAIVSGLAFGVDAAAHEGALEAESGATVAVLACGLDGVYPREHARLAERMLARGGALISEYEPGTPPYARNFLDRNRIVSGLSRGVLIVEAPAKSGALVTARHAAEQGRDVFVVPGPAAHQNYEGSHALIRQGAELVTKPEEILASYGMGAAEKTARAAEALPLEEKQVFAALAAAGAAANVDKIASLAKLTPRAVNRALAFLVAKDIVKETGGGYTI